MLDSPPSLPGAKNTGCSAITPKIRFFWAAKSAFNSQLALVGNSVNKNSKTTGCTIVLGQGYKTKTTSYQTLNATLTF